MMRIPFRFILLCLLYPVLLALQWLPSFKAYRIQVYQKRVPEVQGFLCSQQEVETWADGSEVDPKVLSFMKETQFEKECLFVYTYTHSGSGQDQPTAKATIISGSTLDIQWYDANENWGRTMDLSFKPLVVAARFDPNTIQSIHVHGLRPSNSHTFPVKDVEDKATAFAVLRGLDALKKKSDNEIETLTSISIGKADHMRLLKALTFLPHLEELKTTGIHWTPLSLELLGKLVSLKKLRVGGRYWGEPNNFEYKDLRSLLGLKDLESLDLSFSAVDGRRGFSDFISFARRKESESESKKRKALEAEKRRKAFEEGMEIIVQAFPKLRDLTLEAPMYPEGTQVLTNHPNLTGIHGVQHLSLEVAQILANSRLALQLTSLGFEGVDHERVQSTMALIAKLVNLTHLRMGRVDGLDDTALMELAPLLNLEQFYFGYFSDVTAKGLKVLLNFPNLSVLSMGYCQKITGDGLQYIQHLHGLTHLDLRSIKDITAEQLIRVLQSMPNLVDLNLRYAENVDVTILAKDFDISKLNYLNVLATKGDYRDTEWMEMKAKVTKALGTTNVEFYNEDEPFHVIPPLPATTTRTDGYHSRGD